MGPLAPLPTGLAAAVDLADETLAKRQRSPTAEDVEANISLAEEILRLSKPLCPPEAPINEEFELIMAKLSL